ncbi:MAG: hypothetical protein IJO99_06595 [Ruminococcus sp.]|nr:hypothetical protein [Ruminococcus sp.]
MFDNNDENYNGDYIRPSEEYRADCGVEHGMTYENHDDEQHAYDAHNSAESMFTSMLMSGERILWAGKGKGVDPGATVGIVFGLFWLSFALFWTIGASVAGGIFGAFGIPFILIGIFLVKSMIKPGARFYAITNLRVLKKHGKQFASDRLEHIVDVSMSTASGGKGSITYRSTNVTYYGRNVSHSNMVKGIFGVDNPSEVYRTLNEAIHMATYLN